MAITKQLHEMSLEDINGELDAGGIDKRYKRIDMARKAIIRLVEKDKLMYLGQIPFVVKKKVTAEKKAKKVKAKTKKVEKSYVYLETHELIGTVVYSRFGKQLVTKVGHYEGEPNKLKVLLKNGNHIAISSCRPTAVRPEYRSRYNVDRDNKTPSGKPSIGVDDPICDSLKGANVDVLEAICQENGLEYSKWEHLNPGMQRMCLGNRLRGMARKGERVVIKGEMITPGGLVEAA